MRGRLLAAVAAVLVLLVIAAPSAPAASTASVWVTSGIPIKVAGTATLTASQGILSLHGPAGGTGALQADGGDATVVTIITHSVLTPTGGRVPVEQLRSEETVSLAAGTYTITPGPEGLAVAAVVTGLKAVSEGAASAPRTVWSESNAQLTTVLVDEVLSARVPAMPAEATAAAVDQRRIPAGTPVLRSQVMEAQGATGDVLVAAGVVSGPDSTFTAGEQETVRPGAVWSPGGSWVGPGEHVEHTVVYIILSLASGHLELLASGGLLDAAAPAARLATDGMVQFPWVDGAVDLDGTMRSLDGEQVVLGGTLVWTPVSTSVDGAPQIQLAARGTIDYFHVGALAPPVSASEAAAVAGGAIVAGGAVAAAFWYWPIIKFALSGVFATLYARVPKDQVLEHKGREHVYEVIRTEPGISTNLLAKRVDFGWSTLTYHLRVLERSEAIVSVRDGRHKRFFDRRSGRYANGRKHLVSVLKNPATLDIAKFILQRPGVTQKEVGTAFGLAPSSVHWHVTRLAEADLVAKTRDRHRVRYWPGDNWSKVAAEDVGIEAGLVETAAPGPGVNA